MIEVLYFAMRELGLESQFPHVFCITKGGDYKILDKGRFYTKGSCDIVSDYSSECFSSIEFCLEHKIPIYANTKDCAISQRDKSNHSLEIDKILGYEAEYKSYFDRQQMRQETSAPKAHSTLTSAPNPSAIGTWGYPNHMVFGSPEPDQYPLWSWPRTISSTTGRSDAERARVNTAAQRYVDGWFDPTEYPF